MADSFAQVANQAGAIADQQAAIEGARQGRIDGSTGQPKITGAWTIRGRAYEAAALDTYTNTVELRVRRDLAEFAERYPADLAGFDQATATYLDQLTTEVQSVSLELVEPMRLRFDLGVTAARGAIADEATRQIADRQAASAVELMDEIQRQHTLDAADLFSSDPQVSTAYAAQLEADWARYEQLLSGTGPNGLPMFSEEEKARRRVEFFGNARMTGARAAMEAAPDKEAFYQDLEAGRIGVAGVQVERGPVPEGWVPPVPNLTISSGFGARRDPITGATRQHLGVDIPLPVGTEVVATAAGTVARAETSSSYGNVVYIDHPDGRQTRYAHLDSIAGLSVGDQVTAGQVIGASGSTGIRSTGPHLHFEVRQGSGADNSSRPIDPMPFLEGESRPAVASEGRTAIDIAGLFTPDEYRVLMGEAENAAKQQRAERAATLQGVIRDEMVANGVGDDYSGPRATQDEVTAAYGDRAAEVWHDLEESRRLSPVIRDIRGMAYAEQDAVLRQWRPEGADFEDEAARQKLLADAIAADRALREGRRSALEGVLSAAQKEAAAGIEQRITDEGAALAAGVAFDNPVTRQEVWAAYGFDANGNPNTAAREAWRAVQAMRALPSLVASVGTMRPADQAALLERLRPGGGAGSAMELDTFNRVAKAIEDDRRAWEADPAGRALATNPALQAAFDATAGQPDLLPHAIQASIDAQRAKGVPEHAIRPLPDAVATGFVASWGAIEDPRERYSQLVGITTALGDPAMAGRVLTQLEDADLPKGLAYALDLPPDRENAAVRLMTILAAKEQPDLQGTAATDLRAEVASIYPDGIGGILQQQSALTGGGDDMPGDPEYALTMQRDIDALSRVTRFYMGGGMDAPTAAERAYEDLFGHLVPLDLGRGAATVYLPRGTDEEAAWIGFDLARENLAAERDRLHAAIVPADLNEPGARQQAEEDFASWWDAALSDGQWINYGGPDRFAFVLPDGRRLPAASEQPAPGLSIRSAGEAHLPGLSDEPLVLTLEQILSAGAGAPPRIVNPFPMGIQP